MRIIAYGGGLPGRLKCWWQKGLTCVQAGAYDGLFKVAFYGGGVGLMFIRRGVIVHSLALACVFSTLAVAQKNEKKWSIPFASGTRAKIFSAPRPAMALSQR